MDGTLKESSLRLMVWEYKLVSEAAEEPFLQQVMIKVKFVCFSILFAQRNKYVSSIQVILQEWLDWDSVTMTDTWSL